MKFKLGIIVICCLVSVAASAETEGFQDALLDNFVGKWLLEGTIAGNDVVHDIDTEWILSHQYLQFHEVSHELDETGALAYEAIVTLGWDETTGRYACYWLDSTSGAGLSDPVIGFAKPDGDIIPFKFVSDDGSVFHTTFEYVRESDLWLWRMDSERDGELRQFSRVTLTRQ